LILENGKIQLTAEDRSHWRQTAHDSVLTADTEADRNELLATKKRRSKDQTATTSAASLFICVGNTTDIVNRGSDPWFYLPVCRQWFSNFPQMLKQQNIKL